MIRGLKSRRLVPLAAKKAASRMMLVNRDGKLFTGVRAFASATNEVTCRVESILEEMKSSGTLKAERVITSPQSSKVTVMNQNGDLLNFCANNYLGLANNPRVVEAAKRAMDTHGFGLSSVRFICGTQNIHKDLERAISAFHGMNDTILFPSCFDANAGLFEALLTSDDAVISDELNHASIIDGIRLCKAKRLRYSHRDMASLEEKLIEAKDARVRLIATDGVFSMDGNVAPLASICDLAEKYNAMVFVDDCHATGFFGKTGRGTIEHCGVEGRVAIVNSTLGKALGGGTGGYTTAIQPVVDLLRQKARPYLFSNTVAPPIVGASLEVFKMLSEETNPFVSKVRENTHLLRNRLTSAGFTLSGDFDHPIIPVMLNDAKVASYFADEMLRMGIYVVSFSYPVVPKNRARIRVQISAAHSEEEIEALAQAFIHVGLQLGVIQNK